jgi:hypothetical protein
MADGLFRMAGKCRFIRSARTIADLRSPCINAAAILVYARPDETGTQQYEWGTDLWGDLMHQRELPAQLCLLWPTSKLQVLGH